MIKPAVLSVDQTATPWRVHIVPALTVMLASALPSMLPLIANSPVIPPLGLLLFLCWRLLRAEMWPVWAALPLGLWDDMFSGQPIGCAVGLWTMASIGIDYFDQRIYWRDFRHDWAIAAIAIALIQFVAAIIVHPDLAWGRALGLVLPQIIFAALMVPLAMRLTVQFDNFRLKRR